MKIIEGLKAIKDLTRKAKDLREKIGTFCADLEIEKPEYGTPEEQKAQVAGWLQAHRDIVKEIEGLRLRIQRTNLVTEVEVKVTEDLKVKKSIAAWIHRRKDLALLEKQAYEVLSNRNLKPQPYKLKPTDEAYQVANIRKYYSQQERDEYVEMYTSEPSRIDAALEIVNAITDLVE